jgi:tetratricopeptide (TPR) repeat protein
LEPDCPWHYNWRGAVYLQLEDFEQALSDFSLAIEISKESFYELYFNRGTCLLLLNKLEDALNDLDKAVEIAPEEPSCLTQRGFIFYLMKDYNSALADYTESLKFDPANHYLRYLVSLTHAFKGDLAYALLEIEEAIRIEPTPKMYHEWWKSVLEKAYSSPIELAFYQCFTKVKSQ